MDGKRWQRQSVMSFLFSLLWFFFWFFVFFFFKFLSVFSLFLVCFVSFDFCANYWPGLLAADNMDGMRCDKDREVCGLPAYNPHIWCSLAYLGWITLWSMRGGDKKPFSFLISTVRCSYSQSIQGSSSIHPPSSTFTFDCSNLFNMALADQTRMKIDESGWMWMKVDENGWNWTKVDDSGW